MDYWEPATSEIKKVLAAIENFQGQNCAERNFIEHASLFGEGKPIPDYPQWSNDLGTLSDDILQSRGNPLIGKIAHLLTDLIRRWEYGAMEKEGYRSCLEISALARMLHDDN